MMPKNPARQLDRLCLFGCNRNVVSRGVCGVCHVMILRLVHRGLITWKDLENVNLAIPVDPKIAAHRQAISKSWTRKNRILQAYEAAKRGKRKSKHGANP